MSAPSQKILLPSYFVREIFGIAYWKLQNAADSAASAAMVFVRLAAERLAAQ